MSTVSCVESAHIKKIILPMAEAEGPRNIYSWQSSPWCSGKKPVPGIIPQCYSFPWPSAVGQGGVFTGWWGELALGRHIGRVLVLTINLHLLGLKKTISLPVKHFPLWALRPFPRYWEFYFQRQIWLLLSLMGNLVKVKPVCYDTFKHAWK